MLRGSTCKYQAFRSLQDARDPGVHEEKLERIEVGACLDMQILHACLDANENE